MDEIQISGIRATGFHGVREAERVAGQLFIVDVNLRVATWPAAASDETLDAP